ncbi:MAG: response regulator transcription factor [Chloroflexi bacterium]|nr:response regulator transcription factor [Chloroflexota bacterium]MBU1750576.1 response regulator transcription factor [Chloroflexota bacterium]
MRILVVDDDPEIRRILKRGLAYEGYTVDLAEDGTTALAQALQASPDLVILDLMLPDMDGMEVCRRLRAGGPEGVPILMLTARDGVPDRVAGLDAGADDYLVKPFVMDELLARVRALLRRQQAQAGPLHYADLTLDEGTRLVRRGDRPIELTAREFDLLAFFLRHPRQVLTRDAIYEAVWGYDFEGESKVLEVYIRRLRTKIETGDEPPLIQTVRGVGYVIRET